MDIPQGGGGNVDVGPPSKNLYEGGSISLPLVSDIVFDEARGVIYATSAGNLVTIDMMTSTASSQAIVEQTLTGLTGIDLSPDGRYLAMGENASDEKNGRFWVHIVDLEERTLREIYLPIPPMDLVDGSQSVTFADNDTLFVVASWRARGYTGLWRVSLADDSYTSLRQVWSDTMLQRSLDGSVLGYIEPGHADGELGEIDVATSEVTPGAAGFTLTDLAINADGSRFALPAVGAVKEVTGAQGGFELLDSAEEAERTANAAIYSPLSDELFVAWSRTINGNSPGFIARYAAGLEAPEPVDGSVALATKRASGYVPTRMKISSDGELLFVTAEKSVNVYVVGQ